jgi:hypothetical protein
MRKRTQAQPYRGGGKTELLAREFSFVWFAWWLAFAMQDSCIAENEL